MECLFNDTSKFTLIHEDPTLRNLSAVQPNLNALHKRNEKTLEDKNLMRSKFSQIGLAHRLLKIHKDYQYDTTSTPHYCIEKILSSLLNAFTINNYSVKESFEAAKRIQFIPPELFNQEHKFISFDVTSLFINVPSKKKVKKR